MNAGEFDLRKMFTDERPPIMAKSSLSNAPIEVLTRWTTTQSGALYKRFVFADNETRNLFVNAVLESELENQHPCQLKVADKCVHISIATQGLSYPSDIDQETARDIDLTFSDAIASVRDRNERASLWPGDQ